MMNQQNQLEQNYQAFAQQLPQLAASHQGQFALMRDGEIIEFFDTVRDAYIAGKQLFAADNLFSVQEITTTPVDLGFFSHALPQ